MPAEVSAQFPNLDFLGPPIEDPKIAVGIADGMIDPFTKLPFPAGSGGGGGSDSASAAVEFKCPVGITPEQFAALSAMAALKAPKTVQALTPALATASIDSYFSTYRIGRRCAEVVLIAVCVACNDNSKRSLAF